MRELIKASSWSVLTEIVAKVISPISFLVLTKILSPDDFGVVAVATTFISFVQIVTDLGVSKVIIHQQSTDDNHRMILNNTCFWFNLTLGLFLFVLSVIFHKEIALIFGNVESRYVVLVMSVQILFYSLSSVQNANLKKSLNFKFLFFTRLITIAMPLFIAIPIALLGGGYWAIVIATILGSGLNSIVLWVYSKWKPIFVFNFDVLNSVLSKSIWSSMDELIVWVPIGLDAYLIGNYLSTKDLGMYTTSRTLFSAAIAISLGAILPVLYSHLSSIQDNRQEFNKYVLLSQRVMFSIASILGVTIYILSNEIEKIFFDERWVGISDVISVIFLIMGLSYFYSVLQEALRSKGYFKELFKVKFFSMFFIVPILFLASTSSDIFIYTISRSLSLYVWAVGVFYFAKKNLNIGIIDFIKNSGDILLIVVTVFILAQLVDNYDLSIGVSKSLLNCLIVLLMCTAVFYRERGLIVKVKNYILNK